MSAEWQLNKEDLRRSQDLYIHYAGGLAILNMPEAAASRNLLGFEAADDVEIAIEHAEKLMYEGLRGIVLIANPPQMRKQPLLERRFEAALPVMRNVVDSCYEDRVTARRLDVLSTTLSAFRPAPMCDEAIYHHLAHSRRDKLQTSVLLDGFRAAPLFQDALKGRRLIGGMRAASAQIA